MAPRAVWACQPVAATIASIVAPSAVCSIAINIACLVPARRVGCLGAGASTACSRMATIVCTTTGSIPMASSPASVTTSVVPWRRGMRPDPDLTVSEWADQHRKLSSRASAEPGQYRTARTPYLQEIMDALSPRNPAQRISFMKAAQVGAIEAGNNWVGFVIHHAPGPMLAVLPTVEMAKRTSRGRIDPLIEDSPALKERVQPARSRDAGNSMLSKEFPGGILVLTSASGVSSPSCHRKSRLPFAMEPCRPRSQRKIFCAKASRSIG